MGFFYEVNVLPGKYILFLPLTNSKLLTNGWWRARTHTHKRGHSCARTRSRSGLTQSVREATDK